MGMQHQRREREARKILDEGAQAFESGADRDSCPYHSRIELRELWIRGFESAQRDATRSGPYRNMETYRGGARDQ